MKYQLEYDRILLAKKPFLLEETGELISDISFYLRFGTVFEAENPREIKVEVNESYYCLSDLVQVSYQEENREFSFKLVEGYTEGYEICDYFIGIGEGFINPRQSTKKEIDQIIQKYGDHFSTDQSLQCCSYGIHELKEDSIEVSKKVEQQVTDYPAFVQHMEQLLNQSKKRVEDIPKTGSMAIQFRSECLRLMNVIEETENKKNWLISQNNVQENGSKIMDVYVYLINLVEQEFNFLSQEGMYQESQPIIPLSEQNEEDEQDPQYILSSYIVFDREKNLLRYEDSRMKQLCGSDNEINAYYVTPFSKLNSDNQNNEYCYSTFTKDFIPIETCGILLDAKENEQIIKL